MAKWNPFKDVGPGTLIAAAFIGPGTVTVCSKAGASFGFSLLWALVLSILATTVLQNMAARVGLINQKGLAESVREQLPKKWMKYAAVTLIAAAILIGNSAYQAGNISGGALGLNAIFPNTSILIGGFSINLLPLAIGIIAYVVLSAGSYKTLEKILTSVVIVMSLAFITTALMTTPNWGEVFSGAFIPNLPDGGIIIIISLIGTTVVPYNLFLHASLVQEKWKTASDLPKVKKDTRFSVLLGGLVSMSIVISAAAISGSDINSAADLAKGLEPLFGINATYFLALGLFAAGITSAITAPLAAAYVAKGCFGWQGDTSSTKFKLTWRIVLIIGVVFASLGAPPTQVILFAQVTNGLLLPIIALFLLWIVNRSAIMGNYVNSNFQNVISAIILLIVIGLSVKTFYTLL